MPIKEFTPVFEWLDKAKRAAARRAAAAVTDETTDETMAPPSSPGALALYYAVFTAELAEAEDALRRAALTAEKRLGRRGTAGVLDVYRGVIQSIREDLGKDGEE